MSARLWNVLELVEGVINHLNLTRDLHSCALVARCWVYPARSRRFRAIVIATRHSVGSRQFIWWRFEKLIAFSPHLIHHIRRFTFMVGATDIPILWGICSLPFTNLQHVHIVYHAGLSIAHALAFQELLSVQTLHAVHLTLLTRHTDPLTLGKLWSRCSRSLKYLNLNLQGALPLSTTLDISPSSAPNTAEIRLEALRINCRGTVDSRLVSTFNPLSISALRAVSISGGPDILWHQLVPMMLAIEILDLSLQQLDHALAEQLDERLLDTVLHFTTVFAVELDMGDVEMVPDLLPRLHAGRQVRCGFHNVHWWDSRRV
ncbi:hypothetical protein B0H16DRAFT_1711110 [Mycena metata]|uniref:Uncharacterized protein n=1 Tax=Mycena metata TaxID=1033252 RepID=A0AAD7K7L4_9AGAR|nr:hypothetical protein B0H16DRAFT_1711110 [Mycena metata]